MKARVLVLIAAALVALVGVGAVVLYAQGANNRAVAGAKPQQVYVSDKTVPAGTTLSDAVSQGLVSRTNLPNDATPTGALTEVTPANQDLVAVNDIQAGEYILAARFAKEAVGTQAISVPKGMVAVSAQLSDPAKVGPFMTPGSKIVIYDTYDVPVTTAAPQGGSATEVLLQSVLVIAVGSSSLTPADDSAKSATSSADSVLVTVALAPADATRLVHGIQTGKLYAGLQGVDATLPSGSAVTDSSLFAK